MFIVQVFQDTQLFESVKLYLGNGLEMAVHSVVTPAGEIA